ncbi:MAG: endonuclease/exonuclease/phosphatase family protein [Sphaerochaetaceae bacterium]|jgi:endonuclease/exonuclease/phosphatase family metal-dependent hydrolase|nr:endonuclease/exonuclease/phosphatase family protein [Sphaerochaetaceae bacterium]NLY07696.1 endonuclease/exonuclease/phosphatase family protein [Spirochaetales bacterium]
MKRACFFFAVAVVSLLCCCDGLVDGFGRKKGGLCVVSWNVQNLMDGVVDGNEYAEFQEDGAWDERSYRARLRTLESVLLKMNPEPDVILLQEIESDSVLEDLCRMHLGRKGYLWYGATGDMSNAVQLGFISRVPISPEDVRVLGVKGQRPVIQIHLSTDSGEVVLWCIHAKSRIGGGSETEDERLQTAKVVSDSAISAGELWPGAVMVVAGDFNEDLDLSDGMGVQTALVRDGAVLAKRYGDCGSLVVTGFRGRFGCWYSFWYDDGLLKDKEGSYCYQGKWDRFDDVLCSDEGFDGSGLDFLDAGVFCDGILCKGNGEPNSYDLKSKSGVSDHLPVWLRLR